MILPAQTIRALCNPPAFLNLRPMVTPFFERTVINGMTFGLGPSGYDVRIAQDVHLNGGGFTLASTMESFAIPNDILASVADKSTWARRGIALQNTIIEPGWRGVLTLELTFHDLGHVFIAAGSPIAQIIFHRLEAATDQPYPETGKYQDQEAGPQPARRAIDGSAA